MQPVYKVHQISRDMQQIAGNLVTDPLQESSERPVNRLSCNTSIMPTEIPLEKSSMLKINSTNGYYHG
jgi:hypothetical protein